MKVTIVRAARVIVENLDRHDAVTKMLRSIVSTEPTTTI